MKLPFRETCHPFDAPLPCHLVAYNFWMPNVPLPPSLPDPASLSALHAWYAGVSAREAVERYCSQALEGGQSARGVIGRIRRQLAGFALSRHRADLAQLFQCAVGERSRHRKAATRALDILPTLEIPQPQVSDVIDVWLPARVVPVLHQHGIRALADLTVRIPRRRRWWRTISGLGMRSARHIETFFAAHPVVTERARALIVVATPEPVVPWGNIHVPHDVDGSCGAFRAPKPMCSLKADNDYQAISAWLDRHEAAETHNWLRVSVEAMWRRSTELASRRDQPRRDGRRGSFALSRMHFRRGRTNGTTARCAVHEAWTLTASSTTAIVP